MKKFCIATLTHDAPQRANFLQLTVESLMSSTSVPSVDWYVHSNGKNTEIVNTVDTLKTQYPSVNFIFTYSDKNMGVGAGINALNSHLLDYEYVLFLEGDWITLPEHISGHTDWINSCIQYLDTNTNIDQILLRRYISDVDDRQYGYGYWINENNIKKINTTNNIFLDLVKKEYTNNPHIRRNKKYYEVGIFPLNEFYDEDGNPTELKHMKDWGQAEIQAESKGESLGSTYLMFGNMVHCDMWEYGLDWQRLSNLITGCDKYDVRGASKCKYGYLFPPERFCQVCDHNKNFTGLELHDRKYIDTFFR
jgi:hypothetical protein